MDVSFPIHTPCIKRIPRRMGSPSRLSAVVVGAAAGVAAAAGVGRRGLGRLLLLGDEEEVGLDAMRKALQLRPRTPDMALKC